METLNTLVDLLKSKAKKTTEDDDLLEFEKGKRRMEVKFVFLKVVTTSCETHICNLLDMKWKDIR